MHAEINEQDDIIIVYMRYTNIASSIQSTGVTSLESLRTKMRSHVRKCPTNSLAPVYNSVKHTGLPILRSNLL